jgi:hypothetical protein
MPTLSKPQLFERESPWRRESDRFLQKLCRKGVPILARLNYYAERDLPVPEADQLEVLVQDEEIELKRIAGALTFAAEASEDLRCRSNCDSEGSLEESWPAASRR